MAGILTRAQIENETLDNLAKSNTLIMQSGDLMSQRITRWVNRAQQWIARRVDLLQGYVTTSTVNAQQTYAFPAGIRKIYTLRLLDGLNSRKLDCTMPWEMDRRVPMPAALTTLRSWFYVPYKNTGTFELFPIPDGAYTLELRYSYYPVDFLSSSAVSQYTGLDDAIINYATMFGFRWLQESDDADKWQKYGDEVVAQVKLITTEEQYSDWVALGEGFSTQTIDYTGEYFNNPFIRDSNLNTWWR